MGRIELCILAAVEVGLVSLLVVGIRWFLDIPSHSSGVGGFLFYPLYAFGLLLVLLVAVYVLAVMVQGARTLGARDS